MVTLCTGGLLVRDAVEDAGLWAVEFLVSLAVLFGEIDHQFEVRAMQAGERLDVSTAAENALQKPSVR